MVTDAEIDEIYNGVDTLLLGGCFGFLNEHLLNLTPKVWRMDIDVLMSYATITLSAKRKLPARKAFIAECMRYWSDVNEPDLWKGLE